MIQRSLLRQARVFSSKLPHTSTIPSRHYSSPLRISPTPISPSRILFSKSFSTTPLSRQEPPASGEASASEINGKPAASEAPPPPPEDLVKKELEAKDKEIIDLKDKYLRSVAEFRNLQDRTKRDVAAARDFAITRFAKDLIDSIDNLDRALGTVDPSKLPAPSSSTSESDPQSTSLATDLRNLHEGLRMTERILMETVKKHGLERFDPSEKGEKFDPNLHEAMFMTGMEGKDDGSVFVTQQKGFLLNGRVVRAAKVGVVKNS